jgi:hypothetical protein
LQHAAAVGDQGAQPQSSDRDWGATDPPLRALCLWVAAGGSPGRLHPWAGRLTPASRQGERLTPDGLRLDRHNRPLERHPSARLIQRPGPPTIARPDASDGSSGRVPPASHLCSRIGARQPNDRGQPAPTAGGPFRPIADSLAVPRNPSLISCPTSSCHRACRRPRRPSGTGHH